MITPILTIITYFFFACLLGKIWYNRNKEEWKYSGGDEIGAISMASIIGIFFWYLYVGWLQIILPIWNLTTYIADEIAIQKYLK